MFSKGDEAVGTLVAAGTLAVVGTSVAVGVLAVEADLVRDPRSLKIHVFYV